MLPPPPKNYKISSAFSYNFKLALTPASIVELAKTFSVSTDYLLGVEPLASINVSGLDEKDVAALAMLADRLRATKD